MERRSLYFELWDGIEKSLEGPSAVQFISTSTIVIHTLVNQRKVYLDFFSCKKFNPKTVTTLLQDMYLDSISEETGITKEEIAFKKFESKYRYDWYAQPDGGDKTVIFSYYPKGQYLSNKLDYEPPTKFEAESLQQAFNYAFAKEGLIRSDYKTLWEMGGKITGFNSGNWSKIHPVTHYFSIGEQKWKPMPTYE